MATPSTPKPRATKSKPPPPPASGAKKPPALDGATLSLKELAEAVLAGQLKPRAADLRRLAEGVLKRGKDGSKKGKGKKTKNKLPKIPGQKKGKAKP